MSSGPDSTPGAGGRIALKIDVDTREGLDRGVPRLLDFLAGLSIRATFFVSFGPDNSGKAIWNVLRRRGFLRKMIRSGAPSLYGMRTILSGTLLRARPIGDARGDLVREIESRGHEVGVHAWDHRLWQDHLDRLGAARIAEQLRRACDSYERILGHPPRATAAPAWRINAASLAAQDELGLTYSSDLRGGTPCFVQMRDQRFRTLQVPTNLPCPEEVARLRPETLAAGAQSVLKHLIAGNDHVYPAHSEVEGHAIFCGLLERFVAAALERGFSFCPLITLAEESLAAPERVPLREIAPGTIPGRSGEVATCVGVAPWGGVSEAPREG